MKTHTIRGTTGTSQILVGESLTRLKHYLQDRHTVIVSDATVQRLYGNQFPDAPVILIGEGEDRKTLATLETIYQQFLTHHLDRASCVVAIGGGIVCDVAGFAASTFMRGVTFGSVPTTLLAQVDASVGGKTGVNFQSYKNLIGVFAQPEFVLIDAAVLNTLPPRQLGCGFAEAVKHGAIADAALFQFMENHAEAIQRLESPAIERIVNDSIVIKAAIVNRDETERGERRKLNFGHTFGHAVEATLKLPHGEAVAVGMVVAARLSQQMGLLAEQDTQRLIALPGAFHLPTQLAGGDPQALCDALGKDKKREGAMIKFVLLEGIGRAVVQDIHLHDLEALIHDLCRSC